jgi:hypothetical protein
MCSPRGHFGTARSLSALLLVCVLPLTLFPSLVGAVSINPPNLVGKISATDPATGVSISYNFYELIPPVPHNPFGLSVGLHEYKRRLFGTEEAGAFAYVSMVIAVDPITFLSRCDIRAGVRAQVQVMGVRLSVAAEPPKALPRASTEFPHRYEWCNMGLRGSGSSVYALAGFNNVGNVTLYEYSEFGELDPDSVAESEGSYIGQTFGHSSASSAPCSLMVEGLLIEEEEAISAPEIMQDTLTLVERGAPQAYIPFMICNSNSCADHSYNYNIRSKGYVGAPINQSGTIMVPSRECKDVYGIIDAYAAVPCASDTLTILAWTIDAEVLYDTCVVIIHVIEPQPVPVFNGPVLTVLVLALIIAAAFFVRRRAVIKV